VVVGELDAVTAEWVDQLFFTDASSALAGHD
jgi:hypothetical protein